MYVYVLYVCDKRETVGQKKVRNRASTSVNQDQLVSGAFPTCHKRINGR